MNKVDREAIAQFERVGRSITAARVIDPPFPRSFEDVIKCMLSIDPRCMMGGKNPVGGDLPSHRAQYEFFEAWKTKQQRDEHGV